MATYTLTTNGDNLVGTLNSDNFNATYDAAVTDTFSANDFLNGGAGIDTLYIAHLLDVAITPADSLWTHVSNIEKVVINTTGNGAQTITTGVNFQAAFSTAGVDFATTTTGAGAINLSMTSFTGAAILRTTSTDGAQTIVTGSGSTIVAGAVSGAGALNIKGVGLDTVFATTTGAGAQTIGDGIGNGANLIAVTATSVGGAQDIISTSADAVTVVAISNAGRQNILTGAGADTITASTTNATNTIDTGIGNDTVTIFATASGGYTINAGDGNDTMTGGAGNDTLNGGYGDDVLDGGAGVDDMIGGDGSDLYYVGISTDRVIETNALVDTGGIDIVYSSIAAYTLTANVENGRVLSTGLANLTGNNLSNVLYAGIGDNILAGGIGIDIADYSYASSAVDVSLAVTTAQITGGSGSDTLISIEGLTGSRFNDALTSSTGNSILNGNAGNDWLIGDIGNDTLLGGDGDDQIGSHAGNDSLSGGNGSDTLSGGSGNDILNGEAGNDFFTFGQVGDDTIIGGSGIDTLDYSYSNSAVSVNLAITTAQVVSTVVNSSGTDTITGIENLVGSLFNDILIGDDAANSLTGNDGNDTMTGGLGSDTYYVDNSGDNVIETSSLATEIDTVNSSVSFSLAGYYLEKLNLTGTAAINGSGNSLNNTLIGNAAANVLNGSTGDDILNGGAGNDILTGGTENDIFQLTNFSKDTITDFSVVDDTIQLENSAFTKLISTGALSAANFKAGTAAADANDYIVYNSSTGALFYDADGNGAVAAVQIALLGTTTHPTLTVADFVII